MFSHPQKSSVTVGSILILLTLQTTGTAKLRWTGENLIGAYKRHRQDLIHQKGQYASLPLAKAIEEAHRD